ncbi:helix-turn-helix domain-containing protein [Kribbella sp. NPDC059898]|uniref:helix-turn-helix domain-containing protein n=1 Tax=Kribbella sp. NPDC059898 TaxID=3346995 RepID=UPI0036479725
MLEVLRRIQEGERVDLPGVQSTRRGPQRPGDLLTEADRLRMARLFRSGAAKHKIATEYGVSLSTVKRILRKHR